MVHHIRCCLHIYITDPSTLDPRLAQWISHGKQWPVSKEPEFLTKAHNALIRVPTEYLPLIPECYLPIIPFLAFDLPPILDSLPGDSLDAFFSPHTPSSGSFPFASLPIPPRTILSKLRDILPQKWLDGHKSLVGLAPNCYLPFWAITFWLDMTEAVTLQRQWFRAYSWFHANVTPVDAPHHLSHVFDGVGRMFGELGWNVYLHGPSSLFKSPVLTQLFDNGPLGGNIIDHVMLMFRDWATNDPTLHSVHVETLDFQYPFYLSEQEWSAFDDNRPNSFGYLRDLARKVRTTGISKIVAPLHLPGVDHWTIGKLDFSTSSISHGDGLQFDMRRRDLDGMRRFAEKVGCPVSPRWRPMQHPKQDDTYSCGVIAWNICEKELWPETRLWEPSTKHLERIEYAVLLCTQRGSAYCLVCEHHQLVISDPDED